tara:strand:+ start:540 stop:770 length:231 start_codon:yes stop_codon:yes gene_type:complete
MTNFNEFINYCLDFYGQGGIYPQNRTREQVAYATTVLLDACSYYESIGQDSFTWGGGDSLDRERVRDLMNDFYGEN